MQAKYFSQDISECPLYITSFNADAELDQKPFGSVTPTVIT